MRARPAILVVLAALAAALLAGCGGGSGETRRAPTAKGLRPQLKAFHLPTEPWTYLIDAEGVIKDRLSGAYGVDELEEAMRTILPG